MQFKIKKFVRHIWPRAARKNGEGRIMRPAGRELPNPVLNEDLPSFKVYFEDDKKIIEFKLLYNR